MSRGYTPVYDAVYDAEGHALARFGQASAADPAPPVTHCADAAWLAAASARRRAQPRLSVRQLLRQIWREDGAPFWIGEPNGWQSFWLRVGWALNTHSNVCHGNWCWTRLWWLDALVAFLCPVCALHGVVRLALLGRPHDE